MRSLTEAIRDKYEDGALQEDITAGIIHVFTPKLGPAQGGELAFSVSTFYILQIMIISNRGQ